MAPTTSNSPEDDAQYPEYFTSLSALTSYFDHPHAVPIKPLPARRRPAQEGPRLLVCHDYKGGYNDQPDAMGYTFNFWPCVDTFIYFSHYRVAPPPASWITAAHREGVPILGTLIFEWDESKPDITLLTSALPSSPSFASLLAQLAHERGFDGWLINVEVALPGGRQHVEQLLAWIHELKTEMYERVGKDAQVIWYDSVTDSGLLAWQDKLCAANAPFFAAAGKLFTNYTWAAHYPLLSAQYVRDMTPPQVETSATTGREGADDNAQHAPSTTDIYTGIDVWGRGTHGGGGFQSHWALDHIREAGTSTALFGPAWTWESQEERWAETQKGWEGWWEHERRFWMCDSTVSAVTPSYTPSPPSTPAHNNDDDQQATLRDRLCAHTPFRPIAHFFPQLPTYLPFSTSFCPGTGRHRFQRGERVGGAWTDVGQQSYVPGDVATLYLEDAWEGSASIKVVLPPGDPTFVGVREVVLVDDEDVDAEVVFKSSAGVCVVPAFFHIGDGSVMEADEHEDLVNGWRRTRITLRRLGHEPGEHIALFGVRVCEHGVGGGNDVGETVREVLVGALSLQTASRHQKDGPINLVYKYLRRVWLMLRRVLELLRLVRT